MTSFEFNIMEQSEDLVDLGIEKNKSMTMFSLSHSLSQAHYLKLIISSLLSFIIWILRQSFYKYTFHHRFSLNLKWICLLCQSSCLDDIQLILLWRACWMQINENRSTFKSHEREKYVTIQKATMRHRMRKTQEK